MEDCELRADCMLVAPVNTVRYLVQHSASQTKNGYTVKYSFCNLFPLVLERMTLHSQIVALQLHNHSKHLRLYYVFTWNEKFFPAQPQKKIQSQDDNYLSNQYPASKKDKFELIWSPGKILSWLMGPFTPIRGLWQMWDCHPSGYWIDQWRLDAKRICQTLLSGWPGLID